MPIRIAYEDLKMHTYVYQGKWVETTLHMAVKSIDEGFTHNDFTVDDFRGIEEAFNNILSGRSSDT